MRRGVAGVCPKILLGRALGAASCGQVQTGGEEMPSCNFISKQLKWLPKRLKAYFTTRTQPPPTPPPFLAPAPPCRRRRRLQQHRPGGRGSS